MNDALKIKLISAFKTFTTTFIVTIAFTIQGGSIEWTAPFWMALATSAGRAGLAAVIDQFIPTKLGGKKN